MNGDQSMKVFVRESPSFSFKADDDPVEIIKQHKCRLIKDFSDCLSSGLVRSERIYPDGRRDFIPKDNMDEYTIKFEIESSRYDYKVVMRVYTI